MANRTRPDRAPTKAFREVLMVPDVDPGDQKIGRPKRKKRKRDSTRARRQQRRRK